MSILLLMTKNGKYYVDQFRNCQLQFITYLALYSERNRQKYVQGKFIKSCAAKKENFEGRK